MKQVLYHTVGTLIGGPLGGLFALGVGSAHDASLAQRRAQRHAASSQQRMETAQKQQLADASSERNKLLQEGSRILRRRTSGTTYSGAA